MDAPSNRRGSAGGSYSGDLSLPLLGVDRIIEVKVRARGFAQLYDWLEGRDLLVIRADRIEPLIVLPVKLAIQFARALSARRIRGRPIHRTTAITTRVRQMTPPAGIQPQKTV